MEEGSLIRAECRFCPETFESDTGPIDLAYKFGRHVRDLHPSKRWEPQPSE